MGNSSEERTCVTAGLLQDWIMKNSSKILESSLCFWDILWWYNMALKYGTILRHDNVVLSFFDDDVFQEQSGIIIFYFVTYHRTLAFYFVFQTCDHSLFPKQIHKCFSVIQNLVLLLQFLPVEVTLFTSLYQFAHTFLVISLLFLFLPCHFSPCLFHFSPTLLSSTFSFCSLSLHSSLLSDPSPTYFIAFLSSISLCLMPLLSSLPFSFFPHII